MTHNVPQRKVVYLFGAGASHASIKAHGSGYGILMADLNEPIARAIRKLVDEPGNAYTSVYALVNELLDAEGTDLEHIITFLDESPSAVSRRFADDLRRLFYDVLSRRLSAVESEIADSRFGLYSMLFDMYNTLDFPEQLSGVLTLNYDDYIEAAISSIYSIAEPVDFGITFHQRWTTRRITLLKLHGSFTWKDSWPIERMADGDSAHPLWIPPGIQKAKDRYPFNVLWERAREMLQCDLLRVVGCRLGPNDWDLLSLLFTTRHASDLDALPYVVEVIDSPGRAEELKRRYPFLDVRSILDITDFDIGRQLVGELTGGAPRPTKDLTTDQFTQLCDIRRNWFRVWLEQMAEALYTTNGPDSLDTDSGIFRARWEEMLT